MIPFAFIKHFSFLIKTLCYINVFLRLSNIYSSFGFCSVLELALLPSLHHFRVIILILVTIFASACLRHALAIFFANLNPRVHLGMASRWPILPLATLEHVDPTNYNMFSHKYRPNFTLAQVVYIYTIFRTYAQLQG